MKRAFPYRKALVTGASSGLGRAFAEALLAEGVEVWATSRDPSRLPERAGLRAVAFDLSDAPAFAERFFSERSDIDLLVNNAGWGMVKPFEKQTEQEARQQLDALLAAPITLSAAAARAMQAGHGGAIVNVSSLAGAFPIPYMSLYNAAKAGLSAYTKTLALELAGANVVAIDFRPGDFCTSFGQSSRMDEEARADPNFERAAAMMRARMENGPPPELAARALLKALRRRRSATVDAGDFFQSRLGPLAARLAPSALVLVFLRKYYRMSAR